MFNQLTRRKDIPAPAAPLRIRQARPADAAALERLAALDSSQVPVGELLLAEVGDELWAAYSVDSGDHVADPLRPSANAVLILAERGAQLRRRRRPERRRSHGGRLRFA
jgi:hypothetical protein